MPSSSSHNLPLSPFPSAHPLTRCKPREPRESDETDVRVRATDQKRKKRGKRVLGSPGSQGRARAAPEQTRFPSGKRASRRQRVGPAGAPRRPVVPLLTADASDARDDAGPMTARGLRCALLGKSGHRRVGDTRRSFPFFPSFLCVRSPSPLFFSLPTSLRPSSQFSPTCIPNILVGRTATARKHCLVFFFSWRDGRGGLPLSFIFRLK